MTTYEALAILRGATPQTKQAFFRGAGEFLGGLGRGAGAEASAAGEGAASSLARSGGAEFNPKNISGILSRSPEQLASTHSFGQPGELRMGGGAPPEPQMPFNEYETPAGAKPGMWSDYGQMPNAWQRAGYAAKDMFRQGNNSMNRGLFNLGERAQPMLQRMGQGRMAPVAHYLQGGAGDSPYALGRNIMTRGVLPAMGVAGLANAGAVYRNNAYADWQQRHPIQSLLGQYFKGMPEYQHESYMAPSFMQR